MTSLSGFDAWLTREPSLMIDPHAPWEAWRTDGMYEPEVPAQVVLGDPEDENTIVIDMPYFEIAQAWADFLNRNWPKRDCNYKPNDPHGYCTVCGDPSPAAIEQIIREEEEARSYEH